MEEYKISPWNVQNQDRAEICNDSFMDLQDWFETLSNDDKEEIE